MLASALTAVSPFSAPLIAKGISGLFQAHCSGVFDLPGQVTVEKVVG
jgi:hypothetical protein